MINLSNDAQESKNQKKIRSDIEKLTEENDVTNKSLGIEKREFDNHQPNWQVDKTADGGLSLFKIEGQLKSEQLDETTKFEIVGVVNQLARQLGYNVVGSDDDIVKAVMNTDDTSFVVVENDTDEMWLDNDALLADLHSDDLSSLEDAKVIEKVESNVLDEYWEPQETFLNSDNTFNQ